MTFPKRINISFELSPELDALMRKLNRIIVNDGFDEITFQGRSPHIPHVTLLMGEVENALNYQHLVRSCNQLTQRMKPLLYKVSHPYLKRPSQHFIFLDVHPQERFRKLRRSLHQTAGEMLECDHHGGPDNPSHVTIGYANQVYPNIQKLVEAFQEVDCRGEAIQICEAGYRGTCVKVFERLVIG